MNAPTLPLPEGSHPRSPTERIRDGIGGSVVSAIGIDPAQVQRIATNVEQITADVATISGGLAALVAKFSPKKPPQ